MIINFPLYIVLILSLISLVFVKFYILCIPTYQIKFTYLLLTAEFLQGWGFSKTKTFLEIIKPNCFCIYV